MMLTVEQFMKEDPPADLSEDRKVLWKCVSPRARTAFAIALDWSNDDEFWTCLDELRELGFNDLVSLGSKNMGLTPTRLCKMCVEYEFDIGSASRFKAIMTEAMKAQDKNKFGEFLKKHVGGSPDLAKALMSLPGNLPESCSFWHSKNKKRKREGHSADNNE